MASGYVTLTGLDKILNIFHQLPKRVQKAMLNEFQESANEIKVGAQRDAPKDEGRVSKSISIKKMKGDEFGFEVVVQSNYAAYLEFGTKKHYRPQPGLEDVAAQFKGPTGDTESDPLKAITAWVKRKGLAANFSVKTRARTRRNKNEAKLEKQIAFLIYRKIMRDGIKAQPFLFKQVEPAETRLKKRLADIIQQVI